jgi:hypothetical protein
LEVTHSVVVLYLLLKRAGLTLDIIGIIPFLLSQQYLKYYS